MIRSAALALTVLTGFAGLVYEVTWQKYLATLLGSHGEATAAVLAIFLGGLAAGYAAFGRWSRRLTETTAPERLRARLLRTYGVIEIAIGAYALLFPTLFTAARHVSLLAPFHAGLGFAFDVALTVLLIGPPTILMGATIPFLTLSLPSHMAQATRVHAWVYGLNTVGAFAGALAGGFLLIPWLGLDGSLRLASALNLGAGTVFLGLAVAATGAIPARESVEGDRVGAFAAYATVAALSGFAMMALQTTLNRIGALSFGASQFTFAMVVSVFVLCIACGSLAVSAFRKIPPALIVGTQWMLFLLLALLYFEMDDSTYYAHALRMVFRDHEAAFYPFFGASLISTLCVLLVPIGLSGALLPLLFHHLRREVGSLGDVAGRLYSWNTIGSLLGALLGGYLLLFWLELHHIYRISLAALLLAAGILTVVVAGTRKSVAAALVTVGLAGIASLPQWDPERLAAGLFRMHAPRATTFAGPDAFFRSIRSQQIIFHTDDPVSSVTVKERPRANGPPIRALVTNGKSDGSTGPDRTTMAMIGLVPALLTDDIERVFVVGYGLGVTVGELAALEETREIHVAEISQGVIDAAPLFDYANLGAIRSPKVKVHRADAYRTLLRSEGAWNLIVSEPSNPWVTGVEMLYSVDFLRAARARLALAECLPNGSTSTSSTTASPISWSEPTRRRSRT